MYKTLDSIKFRVFFVNPRMFLIFALPNQKNDIVWDDYMIN